ncbi:hypothetical protein N9L68_08050 [bacterium]|nr:hypothetical protein [bacterium]
MARKDTNLAMSKTTNQGRKRTRDSQPSSSGAPQHALVIFLNFLGDDKLIILRKCIDKLAKQIDDIYRAAAWGGPKPADVQE